MIEINEETAVLAYNKDRTLILVQKDKEIFVLTYDRQFSNVYRSAVANRILYGIGFRADGSPADITKQLTDAEILWLTHKDLVGMIRSATSTDIDD